MIVVVYILFYFFEQILSTLIAGGTASLFQALSQ